MGWMGEGEGGELGLVCKIMKDCFNNKRKLTVKKERKKRI